jgi:hypothetical protein
LRDFVILTAVNAETNTIAATFEIAIDEKVLGS